MSAVLGISANYHDAAAALVVDGRIVAAMQEERFSRVKNDASLPLAAARACLRRAGLVSADLDAVAFYENPYSKLERVLLSVLRAFPSSWRQFPRAVAGQLGDKLWIVDQLAERLGVERRKIRLGDHHRSHAASAFYCSPYPAAAVLTVDGVGEETSTAIWHGDAGGLRLVERIAFPHSLGLFYAALTAWLGFEVNEGEYKVMGLAAFGQPRFADEMSRLLHVQSDGSFTLGLKYFAHTWDSELGFSPALEALLGPRRPPQRAWDLSTEEDRRYADVAASAQAAVEVALLALARRALSIGTDALCLAGGVALNAVANSRIAREAGFARVFVQPAAGDAGAALGAAIDAAVALGDPRPPPLADAALGDEANPADAFRLAGELGLPARRVQDPATEAAVRIARGEVVAWVQGRFELGPRALGQRSILASPHDAAIRERLNRAIKQREPFRPFAPAVLATEMGRFFDGNADDMTPFMTTVRRVRDDATLDAVRHIDGTARVQTVALDGALAPILRALPSPVVLNTSLNGPMEPICADAVDALAFFARHPVDAMLVGDVLVERKP